MNKEEIEAKLEQAKTDKFEINKQVQQLEKQLRDAEKLEKLDKLLEKPKLMKDWDKPFENWESKPAYKNAIQIIIEVTESGIFFGNSGDGATFDLENITKIHSKLGHAIAELKRKKEIKK